MSLIAIRKTLEVALFGISPTIEIAWENQTYVPSSSVPYVRAVLMPATPDNSTIGDEHYIEQGLLQITLMYPLQVGTATVMARAELIRTTFKRGNTFTSGGVRVVVTKTPEVSSGMVDGDRFSLPVRVRWQAFI